MINTSLKYFCPLEVLKNESGLTFGGRHMKHSPRNDLDAAKEGNLLICRHERKVVQLDEISFFHLFLPFPPPPPLFLSALRGGSSRPMSEKVCVFNGGFVCNKQNEFICPNLKPFFTLLRVYKRDLHIRKVERTTYNRRLISAVLHFANPLNSYFYCTSDFNSTNISYLSQVPPQGRVL